VQVAVKQAKNASVARALDVMLTFLNTADELGVTDISHELKLDKSVVHRILDTLVQHRLLEQNERTRKYRVGLKLWELGQRYLTGAKLQQLATPVLAKVVNANAGTTGYIGTLDGTEAVYLEIVNGTGPLRLHMDVGKRVPAYTIAMGRAILAALPEPECERILKSSVLTRRTEHSITSLAALKKELDLTRKRGYALNRAEYVASIGAVAAPVIDSAGYPIGSLTVAFPLFPELSHLWKDLPNQVLDAASEVRRLLSGRAVIEPPRRATAARRIRRAS
jgi:IclR family transcriptional regulator, KDG regulon repressor